MSETYSYRLNHLFEEIVQGKYYEVIAQVDEILKAKDISVEERIEALLAKSMSFEYLALFEFSNEYDDQILELISEAYRLSTEIDEIILIFDTIFVRSSFFSRNNEHREVDDDIETAIQIYERIKKEHKDLAVEKKAILLSLMDLRLFHKESLETDYKWNFKESISFLEEALEINTESIEIGTVLNKILTFVVHSQISLAYGRIGDFKKAIEYRNKQFELAKRENNKYIMSFMLRMIGESYWAKGELDLLLKYIEESKEISEKQNNIRGVGAAHHRIAVYYGSSGDWKECLKHNQKAYSILSEDGKNESSDIVTGLINNMAVCYYNFGEYDESLNYYDKAIEINTMLGNEIGVQLNYTNKALIYSIKGDFEKALELQEENLEYYERRGFKIALSKTLANIGWIYKYKGLFNKAHENLKEALRIVEEIDSKNVITTNLFFLVLLAIEFNKLELARDYFLELERKSDEIEYKITRNQVLQAEALILAKSTEIRDRLRAELIFEQLLDERQEYDVRLGIIFHLCELLLSELKNSSDVKVLAKLQKYINKMIDLATKNHISNLIVESLWFKAQLSMIILDFEKTNELLNQAQSLAEQKGLNRLTLKIIKTKEQTIQQQIELEDLEKESPSISKRMEKIKIENGLREITNSPMYQFKQNI